MERWKGNDGEVKTTGEKDLTGTSFNERCKTNTRNLNDMIRYLEYAKDSGYPAARVDVEQEEYWAMLIRHLLMDDVVHNLIPIYKDNTNKLLGVRFMCSNCGIVCEMNFVNNVYVVGNQDYYEITKHCRCGTTKYREDDIIEYLEYIIDRWCEVEGLESVKNFEEKERKRVHDEELKKYLYNEKLNENKLDNKESDIVNHSQFCDCDECQTKKPKFGFDD